MTWLRLIPSIDQIVERPGLAPLTSRHGREAVIAAARRAAALLRAEIARGAESLAADHDGGAWIEQRVAEDLAAQVAPSLRRVINATGVIVHTNLGRAPLSASARDRASWIGDGYSNLEYDLEAGARGHRHVHAETLLRRLTGADAAVVVNNNAAATLLVLAALASGREVVVSRGELVEIGGGFRVPDVLTQSGASLREVGTTNRTRIGDYLAAISERTALILRVHPSNFRIEGFTERPALTELTTLAQRTGVPLFEDLGSGWLGVKGDAADVPDAIANEPSVVASLQAGVDLVAFSGDKLLGGPQAGIVLGRRHLIDRVRRHPLMRALRTDKLTYAALEATLAVWAQSPAHREIPVYRMMTMTLETIAVRAQALADRLHAVGGLRCSLVDGASTTGGGSAPGSELPTRLVVLDADGMTASELESRLRGQPVPVVARIHHDRVVIDLRTVSEDEEAELERAIRGAVAG